MQTTGFEPTHAPAWQVSVCVHPFPSLHPPPSFRMLQPSQQALTPTQLHALPTHIPFTQWSPWVWGFKSSHNVPSIFAGFEQVPVCVSHVPARWHWS